MRYKSGGERKVESGVEWSDGVVERGDSNKDSDAHAHYDYKKSKNMGEEQ
jgi:hypothetical protein